MSKRPSEPHAQLASHIARAAKASGISVWLEVPGNGNGRGFRSVHASGFARPESLPAEQWQAAVHGAVSRAASRRGTVRVELPHANGEQVPLNAWFLPFGGTEGNMQGVAGFIGGAATGDAIRTHADLLRDSLGMFREATASDSGPSIELLVVGLLKARRRGVAARVAVDWLADSCKASTACLLEIERGHWRLLASQGVKKIERGAPAVRQLEENFGKLRAGTAGPAWQGGSLDRFCSAPGSECLGVMISQPQASPEPVLKQSAPLIAHALWERRPWWDRLPVPGGRRGWKFALISLPVVALALAFFPVPHTISGKCELVPSDRASAVFETAGKVSKILAGGGEAVERGQPLVVLDPATLRSSLNVAEQDLLKKESQARQKRKEAKMGEFRIASIETTRAREEADRIREELARTTLVAPVRGIILTKDLRSRSGDVIAPGTVWCEIASLDAWDLEIRVDEADAGILAASLRDRASLECRYVLNARTDTVLRARVGVADVSRMVYPDNGRQVLFVTVHGVELPPELSAGMRPGFTGFAKIEGARRPWITVALARLVQWFQMQILW